MGESDTGKLSIIHTSRRRDIEETPWFLSPGKSLASTGKVGATLVSCASFDNETRRDSPREREFRRGGKENTGIEV